MFQLHFREISLFAEMMAYTEYKLPRMFYRMSADSIVIGDNQ